MGAEGADGKASNGDDGVVNIIPINPSVINGDLSFQDSGDEMEEVFESLPVEEVEELGEENEKVNGEGEEDNGLSDEVDTDDAADDDADDADDADDDADDDDDDDDDDVHADAA